METPFDNAEQVPVISASQLQTGQIFAHKFQIIRRLKQGGMGTVYEAMHKALLHKVALKVMLPELIGDGELLKKFLQEAQVSASLRHDNIVYVQDADVDDETGLAWLGMELLDGQDLEDAISEGEPMSLQEARSTCRQIASALHYAHGQGLVHRDIKPSNIFLCAGKTEQAPRRVKILDFGIARVVTQLGTARSGTASWGSPLWMTPEQILTDRPIGPGTDIWPLGLLTFYILTGHHYWRVAQRQNASLGDWMSEALSDNLPPASKRARELGKEHLLPPGYDAWFSRCVTRELDRRYDDALRASADFEALSSHGQTPWRNLSTEISGRRVPLVIAGTLACVTSFLVGKHLVMKARQLNRVPVASDLGLHPSRADAAGLEPAPPRVDAVVSHDLPPASDLHVDTPPDAGAADPRKPDPGPKERRRMSKKSDAALCAEGHIDNCQRLCSQGFSDGCEKEIKLRLSQCRTGSCTACIDLAQRAADLKNAPLLKRALTISCTLPGCEAACVLLNAVDK